MTYLALSVCAAELRPDTFFGGLLFLGGDAEGEGPPLLLLLLPLPLLLLLLLPLPLLLVPPLEELLTLFCRAIRYLSRSLRPLALVSGLAILSGGGLTRL